MRFSFRRLAVVSTACVVVLTLCAWFTYHGKLWLQEVPKFSIDEFKESDLRVKSQLHWSNYEFTHTKEVKPLVAKAGSLEEKCHAFFDFLETKQPDFSMKLFADDKEILDKGVVQKENFFKRLYAILKKHQESFKATASDNNTINGVYLDRVKQTHLVQTGMADITTVMRIYGQCFFNKNVLPHLNNKDLFNIYTKKLFWFFTNVTPTYHNAEHTILLGLPVFENNKFAGVHHHTKNDNLMDTYRHKTNGRGIVLSATTRHAKDIVKLIRVLRALNNELPIQIIYNGDLSVRSQEFIQTAATAEVDHLLTALTSESDQVLPDVDLLKYAEYGLTFPKQDVWFVNVKPTVARAHKFLFKSYTNRILALMFTSFQEVLLFDADLVPLVKPEHFLESTHYQKTGTYFFRDRTLRDTNDYIETNYFTTLMPTKKGIDSFFGISPITDKTLKNPYMVGWRHFMEAGILAYDKHRHFTGLLMTLPLALWQDPVRSSIWGDKEMYWLGLSIAGDENYSFNQHPTASVGQMSKQELKYYPGLESNEVCGTHPGHVSEEGELLWINSGFSFCKKNGHFRDKDDFPFSTFANPDLQSLYRNPLRISAALIPPALPQFRAPGSPIDNTAEEKFRRLWKLRKPDVDELKQPKDEPKISQITGYDPQKGWVKSPICQGYYYCAYDKVDSYHDTSKSDMGRIFEFSEQASNKFNYLGKLWITGSSRERKSKEQQQKDRKEKMQKVNEENRRKEELKAEAQEALDDSTKPTGPTKVTLGNK